VCAIVGKPVDWSRQIRHKHPMRLIVGARCADHHGVISLGIRDSGSNSRIVAIEGGVSQAQANEEEQRPEYDTVHERKTTVNSFRVC
jgi:hypothetical protein